MIACTHPGKMGDALYALPSIRKIYEITGEKADFYTSKYCAPLKDLFEFQECINNFYMPDNYVVERMDMGVQPWRVPVDMSLYNKTYHFGFRRVPDRAIHEFIAIEAGLALPVEIRYDIPMASIVPVNNVVIAPRGETTYKSLFREVALLSLKKGYEVYIIGGFGDNTLDVPEAKDLTGMSMLGTTFLLAQANAFLGLMSSQLVLANGFSMPKIAPHDGRSWDMRHVVYSDSNFYPINPTAEQVVELMNL